MRLRVVGIVALPTEVLASVRPQINLRNSLSVEVGLRVAGPAKTPVRRLGGSGRPRRGLVLLRRGVARGTEQHGVMRDRLLTRDLAVAGAALLRHHRRLRRMRVVTADTWLSGIVGHPVDLRESSWTRRVVRVAEGTEPTIPRRRWFDGHRTRCVFRRRPVAHLACNPPVIGSQPLVGDRPMAHAALLVPRVLLRVGLDGVHCGSAIVPDFPERLGHQEIPGTKQSGECQGENGGEAWNLLQHLLDSPEIW